MPDLTTGHPDLTVVVGGGVTGLTAAYTLGRERLPFLLLERGPRWGGLIRSERVDGFLLEGGPDALLAQKPEGLALCREVGLGERLVPANREQRAVYVLRAGRLQRVPDGMVLGVPGRLEALLSARLFSWPGRLRMAAEVFVPPRRDPADESVGSFFRRRLGEEALTRLGEPLLGGIHAGDVDRLSVQATLPRLRELEMRHGSLIRGLARARSAGTSPPAPTFYSLAGGLGELVDALVRRLPRERARTGVGLLAVERTGAGYRLRLSDGTALRARSVILAIPPPQAAAALRGVDGELAELLAGIRFAPAATVLIGLRREQVRHPLDGYGVVIPRSEGTRALAWSFVSTKFPARSPGGHVLLRAFLGGVRDPAVLEEDDRALLAAAWREMAPVLGLSGEPVVSRVYRWPAATPQMEVGHLSLVARVEERLARLPGLQLAGAGLQGAGIPDCVAQGRRGAVRIIEERAERRRFA